LAPLNPDSAVESSHENAPPVARWAFPFVGLLSAALLLFVVAYAFDFGSNTLAGENSRPLNLWRTIFNQDLEQARNTLGGLAEVMAAILGLALTVSSIIVQLAATRFTPHVTSLFFRARTNITVLAFFVVANVFVLWTNFTVGESYMPRWGIVFSMMLLTTSLLLLFPYFAYVFNFLEPDSIIDRITSDGLRAAAPSRSAKATGIQKRQRRSAQAIEHLANIGLNAVQQKDKNIASSAVIALCTYGTLYGDTKAGMVLAWQEIPRWNRQSPDFVSLSDEAVHDLVQRGTWVEWKILRQYQMLFNEGLTTMKDLCYLIAINTRRLGEAAGQRGDLRTLDLSIKFFNTYLRAVLNAGDIRTAYNILHQYRQLGEFVVSRRDAAGAEASMVGASGEASELEMRGLEIAKFMRYYSGIAFQRNLSFITEVIAHDVGNLCEHAFFSGSRCHNEILATFLKVDETAESSDQETTLRGVRRAQVKLATTYLVHGFTAPAREIFQDMAEEPPRRLRSIWHELESLQTREFWEVNDRGTNFDYLTEEQKEQLPVFFGWFSALAGESAPKQRVATIPPTG
jgi:hypothetical protein